MSVAPPIILWFRQDLRLDDNPALADAAARGHPLICLYIHDCETPGRWAPGGASRWWMHHSLEALDQSLTALGQRLVLRAGRAEAVLPALVRETGASAVIWNRQYEPAAIARDTALKKALTENGVEAVSHGGAVLFEPWAVKTKTGGPFKVFTPFWRTCRAQDPARAPVASPKSLPKPVPLTSEPLEHWRLLPTKPDWAGGLRAAWTPGERAAQDRLTKFLDTTLDGYAEARDLPARIGTSRLSPHLHYGEISPLRIWHRVEEWVAAGGSAKHAEKFLAEIGWREFSATLLFHNPTMPEQPLRADFKNFPWQDDPVALDAWQKGRTGYPIVDAGMRELYETGWMHNRVRMIVGSFLVKHLLLPWQAGQDWFWDTLVDADLANNSAGWQWIGGCGADAAPYFRVFNPMTQGAKFDSDGDYVCRWVPELAKLPAQHIHAPWEATPIDLETAGVRLGQTYPLPVIDHKAGRERALAAFQSIRKDAA